MKKLSFPDGPEVVVVAEGDFEPRSIGSYSLRIYSAANPAFPLDDFVAGVVRSREGAVENVKFHDLNREGRLAIIVIIRSAGTGGYLSADAFRFMNRELTLIASVHNLSPKEDLLRALENGARRR